MPGGFFNKVPDKLDFVFEMYIYGSAFITFKSRTICKRSCRFFLFMNKRIRKYMLHPRIKLLDRKILALYFILTVLSKHNKFFFYTIDIHVHRNNLNVSTEFLFLVIIALKNQRLHWQIIKPICQHSKLVLRINDIHNQGFNNYNADHAALFCMRPVCKHMPLVCKTLVCKYFCPLFLSSWMLFQSFGFHWKKWLNTK